MADWTSTFVVAVLFPDLRSLEASSEFFLLATDF